MGIEPTTFGILASPMLCQLSYAVRMVRVKIILLPFIFYQEGGWGLVVLHAFIDNFVMTPSRCRKIFSGPLSTPRFLPMTPPPPPPRPTCITSERFLMLLLQRFRLTINKYNNAYNYFSHYFSNCNCPKCCKNNIRDYGL